MRMPTAFVLSVFLAAQVPAAQAIPPTANHPILGIWSFTLPDGSCSETYRFRGDGTTLVTSAAEVTESEFTILALPSAKGFYKLDDKLVKDNGKADCAGSLAKGAGKMTHFIQFDPAGSAFIMCADESLAACIGPFRRMPAQET